MAHWVYNQHGKNNWHDVEKDYILWLHGTNDSSEIDKQNVYQLSRKENQGVLDHWDRKRLTGSEDYVFGSMASLRKYGVSKIRLSLIIHSSFRVI